MVFGGVIKNWPTFTHGCGFELIDDNSGKSDSESYQLIICVSYNSLSDILGVWVDDNLN